MRRVLVLALFALSLLSAPAAKAESDPVPVIKGFYEVLLGTMKQAKKLGFQGRYDALAPAVDKAFDLPAMTRVAVGPAGRSLSPEQLAEVTKAFRHFTIATYAGQFDGYDGEQFEVGEARPSAGDAMLVPSQLVQNSGERVQLDYVMRQDAGAWKITDVLANGSVSQMAVRRSEFGSVLKRDGLQGLLDVMKKQADNYAAGN